MTKYRYDKKRRTVVKIEEEPPIEQLTPLPDGMEEQFAMLKTMRTAMAKVFDAQPRSVADQIVDKIKKLEAKMINVLVAKQAINNKPIWVFVDQIVAITMNDQGKAVFRTTDGTVTAITDTPEEVIKSLKRMVGDNTPPIDRSKYGPDA